MKKVVKPARNSMVNLAPRISFGFDGQHGLPWEEGLPYMARSIQVKIPPHHRARHGVVEGSLITRKSTHFCKCRTAEDGRDGQCPRRRVGQDSLYLKSKTDRLCSYQQHKKGAKGIFGDSPAAEGRQAAERCEVPTYIVPCRARPMSRRWVGSAGMTRTGRASGSRVLGLVHWTGSMGRAALAELW